MRDSIPPFSYGIMIDKYMTSFNLRQKVQECVRTCKEDEEVKSTVFCDVTQRLSVVTNQSFRKPIGLTLKNQAVKKDFLDCFALQNGTDWLFRNVCN
jgi:cobalamin biosynthesis protein CobT